MRELTVSAVEIQAVRGPRPPATGPHQSQVQQLHLYPEHRPGAGPASAPVGDTLESLYLKISTDQGPAGFYGPIDREAAWPIADTLAGFLIGEDALASSIVWDKLQRRDRHARHGHLKMAISAVDNALWDLRGKAYDAPVWQLLGGTGRREVPAYASTLGTTHEPAVVETLAAALAEEGYAAQKWFMAYGPGDGAEGLARNTALVGQLRGILGAQARIMFDAFMSWDLAYARAWAEQVEHLRPTWLEEPFPPGQHAMFAALRDSTRIPLATGEHLYDRSDVLRFLQDGTLGVIQADPEWCGGVTELVRICALADSFGVPVIPHGHGVHAAVHVIASQSPGTCPMAEYLFRGMPGRHHFEQTPLAPRNGKFVLPTAAGFGIELDEDKIESRTTWSPGSPGR
jgi:L-alanine-DL-glutamate epimerase-like enolase superfamily enzyme